ncbi:hypothetical protein DIPPA_31684 [Diplonema papillatum]|nr:hypothetical protein DIPPA_31684 [Diplonema papillatum]
MRGFALVKCTAAPVKSKSFIPENQQKAVATAVTAAASASAIAGGAGSTLAVLTGFQCGGGDIDPDEAVPLPWEFHPSQVSIGSDGRRLLMGAALMNPLLLAALALVVNGLALAWRWFKDVPWLEAQGSVQSPGVLSVPYLFFIQATSLVAAQLLFFPRSTVFGVLAGGTVLAACVASPILLYYYIVRQIPVEVLFVPDPRVTIASTDCTTTNGSESSDEDEDIKKLTGWKRRVYLFVFGDTVAVSIVESSFYAERWSHICDSYRPKYAVFACLEAGHMIVISLLSAWRPSGSGECNARNFILCLVLFAFAAALLYYRPLKAPMDNLLASIISVMIFVSMLVMAIGIAVQAEAESIFFSGAGYVLLATAAIALVKGIWDVALYLYDLYIERKSKVRAMHREVTSSQSDAASIRPWSPTAAKSDANDTGNVDNYVCLRAVDDLPSEGNAEYNPLAPTWKSEKTGLGHSASVTTQGSLLRVRVINRLRPSISSLSEPLSLPAPLARDSRYSLMSESDNDSGRSSPLAFSRRPFNRTPAGQERSPPPGLISPVLSDHFNDTEVGGARSYRSLSGRPSGTLSPRSPRAWRKPALLVQEVTPSAPPTS